MAWIDLAKVPDPPPKALGTLVLFEVIGPEPDPRWRVDLARTLAGNSKSLAENDNSNDNS